MSFLPMTSGIPMWGRMAGQIPTLPGAGAPTGLQGLLENPLLGAGLGLLSANVPSPNPVNLAGGLMGGLTMANNARTQREQLGMQNAVYQSEMQRLVQQQEEWKAKQEEQKRIKAGQDELMRVMGDPASTPEQIRQAAIGAGHADSIISQYLQPPAETWSEPFSMNVGGKEIMVQRSSTNGQLRSVGSGGVEINMPGSDPLKPTDLTHLRGPNGESLPYGITSEQAAAMGATAVPPQTPGEKTAETLNLDKSRLQQKKEAQQAIANQNLDLLKKEIDANGGWKSIIPGSPAANKIEGYRTAAAIALARAQSPNPDQEPNDPIVQQFRDMLEGHLMGSFGVTSGIEAAKSLIGNPVSQTGQIVSGQGPAKISNDQEYDALPSGTKFVGPDGVMRVKP